LNAKLGKPLFDVEAKTKPLPPLPISSLAVVPSIQTFSFVESVKAELKDEEMDPFAFVSVSKKKPKTVYVSGHFDLLNPGDVKFLESAAKMGDELVVGVVDDFEVCKVFSENSRKIAGRKPFVPFLNAIPNDNPFPVFNMQERALNLLCMGCVSDVVMGVPVVPTADFVRKIGADVVVVDGRDFGELFRFPELELGSFGGGGENVKVERADNEGDMTIDEVVNRILKL